MVCFGRHGTAASKTFELGAVEDALEEVLQDSQPSRGRLCGGTNAHAEVFQKMPPQEKPGTLVLLVGPDTGKIVEHLSHINEKQIIVMNALRWLGHEYHSTSKHHDPHAKHHSTHKAKVEMMMDVADHLSQEGKTAILHSLGPIGIHHALKWGHKSKVHVTTVLAHSLFAKSVKSNLSLKQIIEKEWPIDLIIDHKTLEHGGSHGYRAIRSHLKTLKSPKDDAKRMPFAMKQLLGAAQVVIIPHPSNLRASDAGAPGEDNYTGSNISAAANWYEWRPAHPSGMTLHDQNGVQVKDIVGIPDPYFHVNAAREAEFQRYIKEGIWCVGVTSYQEFPGKINNPADTNAPELYKNEDKKYWERFIGWGHIFRDPVKFGIPNSLPKILNPQSDYIDPTEYRPDSNKPKIYDFIYCCNSGDWNHWCRNWELGEKAVRMMAEKYGLKGVLIGKKGDGVDFNCPGVVTTGFVNGLLEMFQQTKFMFVPNIHDASPRVVAQAMCCDLPVLMNSEIIGGWHYISDKTGMFFDNNMEDFEAKLVQFLQTQKSGGFSPRSWWNERFGPVRAGKRLFDFISALERKPIQTFQ